jgi:glycerol-3-phosphate dehydrogenase
LQQPDGRIVFIIPYEQYFTLIGTTDVRVGMDKLNYAMTPSNAEIDYLLAAANRYLAKPVANTDIIHSYAGVRPLYDDGSDNPSETTRDYTLKLHQNWLDIFGGKITTYRYLAQEAVDKLRPALPHMSGHWSASATLPGGEIGNFEKFFAELSKQYPQHNAAWLRSAAHRHGSNIHQWLSKDLGADLGGGLMQAEADYLQAHEWAQTLDDMIWRRTKCGLHAKAAARIIVSQ